MAEKTISEKHSWITNEFFEDVIQNSTGEEKTEHNRIKVYNLTLEPAVGKGENYSSDVIRAHVKYVRGYEKCLRFTTFFVKTSLANADHGDMLEKYNVFLREIVAYRDILPKVEELLSSIGEQTQLAPRFYKINEHQPKYFIFEDLTATDFQLADKKLGLNFAHLTLVLKKLAKWHAATAFLHSQNPDCMKYHLKGNVTEDIPDFHQFFRNIILACAEEAKTCEGFENHAAKLEKLQSTIVEKLCEVFHRDDEGFNVLNHGDLWLNNIMFKYDSNDMPEDTVMVDYAVGWLGSPAIDLCYLLWTSAQEIATESDRDILVQIYHHELKTILEKLKYPKRIPTLTDIHVEMLRKASFGMIYAMLLIPIRLLNDVANADLSGLLNENEEGIEFRKMLFATPRCTAFMTCLLDYFDRKGFLDS